MPGKDKRFLPGGDCCQLGVVAATEHDDTVGPDNSGVCVVPRLNIHLHVVGLGVVEGSLQCGRVVCPAVADSPKVRS